MSKRKEYKSSRDLPIYTATEKLLWLVDEMMNNFSRDRKHTLGQWIYQATLNLFDSIRIANDEPARREQAIREYMSEFDNINTMLKLANERHYLKLSTYLAFAPILANIERQMNGWLLSSINARVAPKDGCESAS